jgi:hypothetical protein
MRITSVTPVKPEIDPHAALDVSVGEYDDVTSDWYQADVTSLHDEFTRAGIDYLEYTLMRKALGDAANGLLVGLGIWGTGQAFSVLKAWLPAREARKVRIRFKDGTEIEAGTVTELEQIREKFLSHVPEDDGSEE